MREIDVGAVADTVRRLCVEANHELRSDHVSALRRAREAEESPTGREVLDRLLANAEVSARERIAFCQDTGYAVCFLEIGQDVRFTGGSLAAALDRGVAEGYREGYPRASLVRSPMDRTNTGDNTPAMVHYDLVEGDGVRLTLLVKGAGCDNMSALRMLTPAAGVRGMTDFVVETVERAGPSASPPVTIGIGMGGTVTALSVHIETYPTHIAAFPVAINLDCHSHRVREVTL